MGTDAAENITMPYLRVFISHLASVVGPGKVRKTGKIRPRNALLCAEWNIKPY